MFYFFKHGITLILLLFVGVHCYDDDDEGDVPGYGIYKVFVNSKKDVAILNDLARNRIIYPIKKKAFEWKILVRANHEHYFQKRLIDSNLNYFIIQSSLADSLDLFRSNTGAVENQNENQPEETEEFTHYNQNTHLRDQKCFPTDRNCIPDKHQCLPTDPFCSPSPPYATHKHQCLPTDPFCSPSPPYATHKHQCLPTDPFCSPSPPYAAHNRQSGQSPYNSHNYNPVTHSNNIASAQYYPQMPQWPHNYQNMQYPPGHYYYCYYAGSCVPAAPYSYHLQMQHNYPNVMTYPKNTAKARA